MYQRFIVNLFDEIFKERWVLDGEPDFEIIAPSYSSSPSGVNSIQFFLATPGFNNDILDIYKKMISSAKYSVFIENPYMYHPSIVAALIDAKKKNISLRITLILPSSNTNDLHYIT